MLARLQRNDVWNLIEPLGWWTDRASFSADLFRHLDRPKTGSGTRLGYTLEEIRLILIRRQVARILATLGLGPYVTGSTIPPASGVLDAGLADAAKSDTSFSVHLGELGVVSLTVLFSDELKAVFELLRLLYEKAPKSVGCHDCQMQVHTANMARVRRSRAAKDKRPTSEHVPEILVDLHAAGHNWTKVAR